jgi:hypothetical protein
LRTAESLELKLLKSTQELGLKFKRQLADFVEEERASISCLEAADFGSYRASESAPFVPKQFALQQRGRYR